MDRPAEMGVIIGCCGPGSILNVIYKARSTAKEKYRGKWRDCKEERLQGGEMEKARERVIESRRSCRMWVMYH